MPKILSKVSGFVKRGNFQAKNSFEVLSRCVMKNRPMVKASAARTIEQFMFLERELNQSAHLVGEISISLETSLAKISS